MQVFLFPSRSSSLRSLTPETARRIDLKDDNLNGHTDWREKFKLTGSLDNVNGISASEFKSQRDVCLYFVFYCLPVTITYIPFACDDVRFTYQDVLLLEYKEVVCSIQ